MDAFKKYIKYIGKGIFESFFQRSIRVYIEKHLGEFLLEKLTTDQVDFRLDDTSLASLTLNCEAINQRLERFNVPFTFLQGYIDILHLKIPWANLSSESIQIEIEGLELVIKLKETEIDDGFDVKSVFESMTTSMVEEMMKNKIAAEDVSKISEAGKNISPFESVEIMSEFISSITSRIQVKMSNIIIRTDKTQGACVELAIEEMKYCDKNSDLSTITDQDKTSALPEVVKSFTTKTLEISRVTLSVEEVWDRSASPKSLDPIQQSTVAFDAAMNSPPNSGCYRINPCMTQSIYPGMSSYEMDDLIDNTEPEGGGMIPIMSMEKTLIVNIIIKNDEQLPGPSVEVSSGTESLHIFLSPKILNLLTQSVNGNECKNESDKSIPMTHEDYELCRRLQEAESAQKYNSNLFPVSDLTLEKHVEVIHGGKTESVLSDDDMFYSAYHSNHKNSFTGFDVSDSASVSTFAGESSFSTFNASEFSHIKPIKATDRSFSRQWDENMVKTVKVDINIPFFTVAVLLKDPESVKLSSCFDPTSGSATSLNSMSAKTGLSNQSCNFQDTLTGVIKHEELNSDIFSQSCMEKSNTSFKTACYGSDEDEDDDRDEEFHDSGEYQAPSDHSHNIKVNHSNSAQQQKTGSPPKISQISTDFNENPIQTVAVALFKALSKMDSRNPLHMLRDEVASILPLDHLSLLAKPIHVSLNQEKRSSCIKLNAGITFGKLEIIECLFECISKPSDFAKTPLPKLPQYSVIKQETSQKHIHIHQLLAFDVNGQAESSMPYDPFNLFGSDTPKSHQSALTVTIDSVQTKRYRKDPTIKINLDFNSLVSEMDISMLDRLTNLLNRDTGSGSSSNVGAHLIDANGQIEEAFQDELSSNKINLDIQAKAIHATLRIRFPIPDLRVDRPTQSKDWCRRNLHKEVLLLKMESPELRTKVMTDEPLELELQMFKAKAYLQEDINEEPILFGEVSVEDSKDTAHDGHHFNWPRVVVNISNKSNSALETGEESDTSATSLENFIDPSLLKKEFGPFSGKKSMYERDDLSSNQCNPVSDKMVMPGNIQELKEFREKCMACTKLSVDITLPSVVAFFHSRDFLELIYNRFNNDLLMWEPLPTKIHTYQTNIIPSNASLGVMHMFQNVIGDQRDKFQTNTDDSDSELDDEPMNYSIHDTKLSNKKTKNVSPKLLNKLCFSLNIGTGSLLAVIPHQDKSSTDLHAEILLRVKDGLLFSVNEHNGDPDLKFLCLQVNKATLFHNPHLLHSVRPVSNLEHIKNKLPDYLQSRLYRSDRWASDLGFQERAGYGPDSPDMVTLVVKTVIDTINNVKNFTLAVRVDGTTLRHTMHYPGESWISQIIDLLDLKDYPILGYTMPKIMTEIHLQIDHCCVDYRPNNLSVWTFLTVEHFNLCSNIIADSSFSQIRLFFNDSALFLTKNCNKEVNLLKDYVCVAEVDHFKIWLQFCYDKKLYQKFPKSDLRFMINKMDLHTCADSTKALLDLIQYIVNDGDLEDFTDAGDLTPTSSEELPPIVFNDERMSSPLLPTITPEQAASVEAALEDAMIEPPEIIKINKASRRKEKPQKMTTVFFQCDTQQLAAMKNDTGLLQITVTDSSESASDEDQFFEEFEVIDSQYKEVKNIKGSHEVTMLTSQPIEVNENFLHKPTSSYDLLKTPEKFPDPEVQYTLREMSIVWHIYGGSDFSCPKRGSSADHKNLSKGIPSPCFREQKKSEDGCNNERNRWRHRGGDLRDLNVLMEFHLNKIRLRYEIYPAHAKHASRFKLLINTIEIKDKLRSSGTNLFLKQLIDNEHPEQTSTHMLMLSSIFTRPDYLPFRKECEVKVFCLPINLNIDQLSLNFFRKFIAQVSEPDCKDHNEKDGRSSPMGDKAATGHRGSISTTEPIMRIGSFSTNESSMDENELLMKFEDFSNQQSLYLQARLNEKPNVELQEEDLPVFIKSFVLISDITIKLNYEGKGCDMDSGIVGFLLGLASLTGSMIKLRRLSCQKGILGWDKLLLYVYNEWLNDIKRCQIPSILKGVGSFSILTQFVQGLIDLIRLPINQYRKDRRIMRGLQRGANSFTLNTVMAILELTNKLVGSIQYCAEMGYDMMSPGPSVRRRKKRYNKRQPKTLAEGAKEALTLVTEGVRESASNLSAIVSEESAHKGYVGVVGGALRNAAPECLLKPLALLAEAGTTIVQGVRNEVDPSKIKEEEDRWK